MEIPKFFKSEFLERMQYVALVSILNYLNILHDRNILNVPNILAMLILHATKNILEMEN